MWTCEVKIAGSKQKGSTLNHGKLRGDKHCAEGIEKPSAFETAAKDHFTAPQLVENEFLQLDPAPLRMGKG